MTDSGFIDVPGGRLYHEVDGTGPPLVLVHAGVANLRQWDPQVPAWAEHYRVIRYDTRGYGRSESEHVEFTNRGDLGRVLDHFGVAAAHVVGCSRGGQIALDFAVDTPERVASLTVVAGGVGGFDPDLPQGVIDAIIAFDKGTEELGEAKAWDSLADLETAYWVDGPGQPVDRVDPAIRALVRDWIYTNYAAEKESGVSQPLDPPAGGRFGALGMPVLAVVGDLDEAYAMAAMTHIAHSVANGRLEVFENAAHMLNLEQPERFTRLVLEFLDEARVDSAP